MQLTKLAIFAVLTVSWSGCTNRVRAAAFDDLCVVSTSSTYRGDYVYAGLFGGYPYWEIANNGGGGMTIYMDVFTTRKWILNDNGIDVTVKSVNGATNDSNLSLPWEGSWTVADMAVLQGSCASVEDVCVLNTSNNLGGDYGLVTNDAHEGYPYWKHTSEESYLYKNDDGTAWRIFKSLNTGSICHAYALDSSSQFPWESTWNGYETAMVAGTCSDAS